MARATRPWRKRKHGRVPGHARAPECAIGFDLRFSPVARVFNPCLRRHARVRNPCHEMRLCPNVAWALARAAIRNTGETPRATARAPECATGFVCAFLVARV